jgi:hypothetical protein
MSPAAENRDLIDVLQRWEDAGALWRVISRRRDAVTVALFRCDGGEEVERFTSVNQELLTFIGDRLSSAD